MLAVGSVENNRRRGQKKSVPQTKRTGDDGKETDNKGLAAGKDVNFNSVYGSRLRRQYYARHSHSLGAQVTGAAKEESSEQSTGEAHFEGFAL